MGKASKCQPFHFNIVEIFRFGTNKSFLLDVFRMQDLNFGFEWSFPLKTWLEVKVKQKVQLKGWRIQTKQKVKLFWRHFSVPLVLLSTPGTSSFGGTNCFLCPFDGNKVRGASPCTQDPTDLNLQANFGEAWQKRSPRGQPLPLHVVQRAAEERLPHHRPFFSECITPCTLR